jgi:hypothetical protein
MELGDTPIGDCDWGGCDSEDTLLPFHVVDYQDEVVYRFCTWRCLVYWSSAIV